MARKSFVDRFEGKEIGAELEWNHNPVMSNVEVGRGLVLKTATVTDDLYAARNTITRRITGPKSTATLVMDIKEMADGDVAGLTVFRHKSAFIGLMKSGKETHVTVQTGINLNKDFTRTASKGTTGKGQSIEGTKVWLRAVADVQPGSANRAEFSYSSDGSSFKPLGSFGMEKDWDGYYLGYRWGIFNYAKTALGGSIKVESFTAT